MQNPNIFITVKPSLIGFADFYYIIKINSFLIVGEFNAFVGLSSLLPINFPLREIEY